MANYEHEFSHFPEKNITLHKFVNINDNKIDLIADESTYEDALSLFDYCNGNRFARRIMDITIKKLAENKIISKQPDETVSKYSKTHLFTCSVNVKRYLKLKEDKRW